MNQLGRRVSNALAVRRRRRLTRLGDAARDVRNYGAAAKHYSELLAHEPENFSIRVQCAHMKKEIGAFREAEAHYLFAAERRPDDADLQLQIGHFYKTIDDVDKAMSAYARAEGLIPGWAEPLAEINNLSRRPQMLFPSLAAFLQEAQGAAPARQLGSRSRAPVVLVLTDEDENLIQLRIQIPFEAMRRNGNIGGYIVINRGKVVHVGGSAAELDQVDVVWAQRAPLSCVNFLVETCSGNYVYDIDDNLLITPGYRAPWAPEWITLVTSLIEHSRVVTVPSPRLSASLESHLPFSIARRAMVAYNVTDTVSPRRFSGPPAGLLLAASDALPMTTSRATFLNGVEHFCRTRGLPLIYMGSPANVFSDLGCEVINLGMMSYDRYRTALRTQNLLAVAPLELWADERTIEFVNCKSDIKMVEFGAAGVPGVYAKAPPYLESPLKVGPLVDCGDEADLVAALHAVADDADRISKIANESVADLRLAEKAVLSSWGRAVEAGRMDHPMDIAVIVDALNESRNPGVIRTTIAPEVGS